MPAPTCMRAVLYGRSSHHKIEAHLQMLRARVALRVLHRPAPARPIAVHERTAMIAILDYGAGNLRSVENTLCRNRCGIHAGARRRRPARRAQNRPARRGPLRPDDARARRVQVREALIERIRAGVPFLGICLGLQALFESQRRSSRSARSGPVSKARCGASPPVRACRTWAGTSSNACAGSRLLAGLDARAFCLLRA